MCRRSTCCYQSGPDQISIVPLNLVDNREKRLEGPTSQRNSCRCGLVLFKCHQAPCLEDLFGIVGEQHGVTVKSNPQLVSCIVRGIRCKNGCCGMAGSFGYGHYDVSMKVGEGRVFPAVREHEGETVACGFSCRHQIKDATGVEPMHFIEALGRAMMKGERD